ncbi:quinone oxidoreductase [Rhodoblastus acidophilus]|uniref:Quinone oxidoreductase n=1 Tax=Candidatus Rhodoblastus alkanivorans TaxID=2954117 RepID=A0ABS9Z890_9HYPH|nr:quinone oxidoreductase [Candidatus Rhodoblastus alkanivorans]MCI4679624.1 quinone oxidoreductase [Candidatus Rhodoblastus alkanivorans]MCI4683660.1 quinone oxidoreductase [Candidatus Rhodoblastus alkanivorans]MDI4640976.1 quinone oxidoreductase [Rhodoblastus acidophilus]
MVKAIRVHEAGGPEVLRYEDFELAPPGPGEVQIRQHAVGVNYIDVYYRKGAYPVPSKPFILGNEGAGEIAALGEGVTKFKIGDRVAYAGPLGGYAQARNIEAKFVVPLPENVSYETAAAMMLKGLTAEYLLFRSYKVQPGDTILVHAAAGGVGLILCQWAKALGATVIGTVGSEEKAKLAREAGADETILYRQEDWVARVREITGGKLCHAVYDSVGKTTFPGSLDCLRPFGSFISFGSASGPIEAFDIGLLSQKGSLYAQRPSLFTYMADEARLREMAARLMEAVGSGKVKIAINARYKLEDAAQAHRALEGRETTGATVLLP